MSRKMPYEEQIHGSNGLYLYLQMRFSSFPTKFDMYKYKKRTCCRFSGDNGKEKGRRRWLRTKNILQTNDVLFTNEILDRLLGQQRTHTHTLKIRKLSRVR